MKILVLGHNGMLGHMVVKYLISKQINVCTTSYRWDSFGFKEFVSGFTGDYIINCIGSIPQKKHLWETYKSVNILLPEFLSSHKYSKIIHPTTDCEFDGRIQKNEFYSKNDPPTALDDYGISKAYASLLLRSKSNVKQIRTSIIGPELYSKVSLMEWFLKQQVIVKGYSNHYWNGVTTLEWAQQCYALINNWDNYPTVTQIGTEKITKYELLCLLNKIFKTDKTVIPIDVDPINKCLYSDYTIESISAQLIELKNFYYENKLGCT